MYCIHRGDERDRVTLIMHIFSQSRFASFTAIAYRLLPLNARIVVMVIRFESWTIYMHSSSACPLLFMK